METIIVKPKSTVEYKEISGMFRRLKVKAERHKSPSKNQILKSVETGAKSAASYLNGKTQFAGCKAATEWLIKF